MTAIKYMCIFVCSTCIWRLVVHFILDCVHPQKNIFHSTIPTDKSGLLPSASLPEFHVILVGWPRKLSVRVLIILCIITKRGYYSQGKFFSIVRPWNCYTYRTVLLMKDNIYDQKDSFHHDAVYQSEKNGCFDEKNTTCTSTLLLQESNAWVEGCSLVLPLVYLFTF